MSDTQRLSKDELITQVAEATGQTKKLVLEIVDAMWDSVGSAVRRGEKVVIHNFGSFSVHERSVLEGLPGQKNRKKGKRNVVRFKVSKILKADLN
jgi:DNA-binding protein HU-beta